jgi:hypothetical protein
MNFEILLTTVELEYLRRLTDNDESLKGLYEIVPRPLGRPLLRVNRDQAKRLQDYFTNRLATFGFKQDYSPNKEGQLLEDLISKFLIL